MKIASELQPILDQLTQEGSSVYTSKYAPGVTLYWFENGRVLSIHSSSWRNEKYNPDCWQLSANYIPSYGSGSGCRLSTDDWGHSASDILQFRNVPTWVRGIQNYNSMDHFLKLNNKHTEYTQVN